MRAELARTSLALASHVAPPDRLAADLSCRIWILQNNRF